MLSTAQMSTLRFHAEAGDRIAYYSALADYGVQYGQLALGVVLNTTWVGAAANFYFLGRADDEGQSVSADELAEVSLKLMLADFRERENLSGADLTVDNIQEYHRDVFASVANVSANAWTPNIYLDSFPSFQDRQSAWESMLSSSSVGTYLSIAGRRVDLTFEYLDNNPQLGVTIVDLDSMNLQQMLDAGIAATFADWFIQYSSYLVDLQYAFDITPSSNEHGDYDVGIPGSGRMVGGDEDGNSLSGSGGNDVMIGFDGNDTLSGGGGADRFYGGEGNDVVYGGAGGDFILFGNGNDSLYGDDGDDYIFFDADDTVINGGTGRDAAYALGSAVSLNLTETNFETAIGSTGADTFTFGSSADVMSVSGGAGADTINVSYGSGQGTRILWGGEDTDADIFNFEYTGDWVGYGYQLGLLVANVVGLTAANFATFTLSMLGLPTSFDWGAIDAVILNPQAEDELRMWGDAIDASPYENKSGPRSALTPRATRFRKRSTVIRRPAWSRGPAMSSGHPCRCNPPKMMSWKPHGCGSARMAIPA
ncbi:MAG: calcium-binding protein [Pseudomonadota bacterium]